MRCGFSLSAGLILCLGGLAHAGERDYSREFLWGSAFSAHQTEGKTGGGEHSDWYAFEHSRGKRGLPPIAGGDTADVATDHWHRFDEDFAIGQSLGLDSLRISLAWEKIEPRPGEFNQAALDHYREVLTAMRARGLRPMVALHHFTHPLWFQARGSWVAKDSPQIFARYADRVVRSLGDLCDLWITFNEPMVLVGMGFLGGQIPPRFHDPRKGIIAGIRLAEAHRLATVAIHRIQPAKPGRPGLRGVGFVNSIQIYDPYWKWSPIDRLLAATTSEFSNWALPKIAAYGRPGRRNRETDELAKPDWIGINYYARFLMHFGKGFETRAPAGPVGDNGWGVDPEGLARVMREAASRFPGIPLVVSENGMADAQDRFRPELIRRTLRTLDSLVPELDIRGYYHWSLTDNFEWLEGYRFRFGLYEVKYDDGLKRVPRPSAEVYRQEVRRRRN